MDNVQINSIPRGKERVLNKIEWIGNWIPDPVILFLFALLCVFVVSPALAFVHWDLIDPRTGDALEVKNLLSPSLLIQFLGRVIPGFSQFPPFGVVLVMTIGISILDASGWMRTAILCVFSRTASRFLTPLVSAAGFLSHSFGDSGYLLVIPLGGIFFQALGRHPIAGTAAAFVSVSGGVCATIFPGTTDVILQSFTQTAAQMVDSAASVHLLCNYYFSLVSCVFLVLLNWGLTDYIVEPYLLKTVPISRSSDDEFKADPVSAGSLKAFRLTIGLLVFVIVGLVLFIYPESSPFRDSQGFLITPQAPLMKVMIPLFSLIFALIGLIYGYLSGQFQSSADVVNAMTRAFQGLAHYIVMIFFCSLFVEAFLLSNLGTLLSVKGGVLLREVPIPPYLKLVSLILFSSFINLFIPSLSAKWAIFAPIFVPIFMQVGMGPELIQAAYRIGDSCTNIITPFNLFFPLVLTYFRRFSPQITVGTVFSIMLIYSVPFLVFWTILFISYFLAGLPLGIYTQ